MNNQRVVALAFCLAIAACSHMPSWLGSKKEEAEKITGDRSRALPEVNSLSPDPALSAVPVVLPPAANNTDWPQQAALPAARGNIVFSGRFENTNSARIGDGNNFEHELIPLPVIGGGTVFAMDAAGKISAHDAANITSIRWKSKGVEEEADDVYGGGLAYDQGRLYVVSGRGVAAAIDAATGNILWRKELRVPFRSAPRVDSGKLFALTINSQLFALDTATGDVAWTHRGIPETAGLMNSISPAITSGAIIVPYASGEIYALSETVGAPLWGDSLAQTLQVSTNNSFSGIGGNPVVDSEVVFAVSAGGRLTALSLATGQRAWELPIASSNTPWLAGDYLFVLASDNTLAALVKFTGQVRWATKLPGFENEEKKKDPIVWRGPVLINGALAIVGSHGQMALVDAAKGTILETKPIPDGVYTSPIVADGKMYLIDEGATLYSIQ